jgi:hypothetical protein
MRSISWGPSEVRSGLSTSSASASARIRSNSIRTDVARTFAALRSFVPRDFFSQATRCLDEPITVAVASSSFFGTFFRTWKTPCSFFMTFIEIRMLIPPLDTSAAGSNVC